MKKELSTIKEVETTLPVFPLPVFILPGGITRLRIFEPRYLKMIKISSQGQGFVIWLKTPESQKTHNTWGSWVNIVNFDQGDDGILEVDVKCQSLVELTSLSKDSDNLHFADVTPLSHWSQENIHSGTSSLSQSLELLIAKDTLLQSLYSDKSICNDNWVVARWIELLPIKEEVKATFVSDHNFAEAEHFVQSIIGDHKE